MGDDADKFVWSVKNGELAAVKEFVEKVTMTFLSVAMQCKFSINDSFDWILESDRTLEHSNLFLDVAVVRHRSKL